MRLTEGNGGEIYGLMVERFTVLGGEIYGDGGEIYGVINSPLRGTIVFPHICGVH